MLIDGHTQVFFVLGHPVTQVRAPEVFNPLFQAHGVNAVLLPAEVAPERFEAFVHGALSAANMPGLWLTIPHKTPAVALSQHLDRLGRRAGAVNALRREPDGSLRGALFDGLGLSKSLDHFGLAPEGRRVLVLGLGGAGTAVATSLAERSLGDLALWDRDPAHTQRITTRLAEGATAPVRAVATPDAGGFDLVVHCTSLGLNRDDPLPFDVAALAPGAAVVDILMKPYATPLQQACEKRGITVHPGFEMLTQQVPEYLRFFGFEAMADALAADLTPVRQALQRVA